MDAYIGEIRAVAFDYAPEGWALCQGQTLQISQYAALYTVIGAAFGGDGKTTFQLPNLGGRIATQQGQGAGLQNRTFGEEYGSEQVQLLETQIPSHNHQANTALTAMALEVAAPGPTAYLGHTGVAGARAYASGNSPAVSFAAQAIGSQGSNGAHENRQPYTVMNYIICTTGGEFPIRS